MKDGVVCAYIHDDSDPETERAVYVPNTAFLNDCIKKWADAGIEFCGVVHSHPAGQDTMSSGDLDYIKALYEVNSGLEKTFSPLVIDGCDMIVYEVKRNGDRIIVLPDSLEVVD